MLVLSRKTRQQIRIGDNITVTILLVKGQVVRVGVEAPRDVRVLRAELPVFDEPTDTATSEVSVTSTAAPKQQRAADSDRKSRRTTNDVSSRTSPGLLELRRRGSLAGLTRSNSRPTSGALRPLFERH